MTRLTHESRDDPPSLIESRSQPRKVALSRETFVKWRVVVVGFLFNGVEHAWIRNQKPWKQIQLHWMLLMLEPEWPTPSGKRLHNYGKIQHFSWTSRSSTRPSTPKLCKGHYQRIGPYFLHQIDKLSLLMVLEGSKSSFQTQKRQDLSCLMGKSIIPTGGSTSIFPWKNLWFSHGFPMVFQPFPSGPLKDLWCTRWSPRSWPTWACPWSWRPRCCCNWDPAISTQADGAATWWRDESSANI